MGFMSRTVARYATFSLLGFLAGAPGALYAQPEPRGVRRMTAAAESTSERFDVTQSAGLFVGVRSFTHDEDLAEVPYAVDDAVDLAFQFALEWRSRLVEPGRVKLALSGEPQKPESRQRLDALLAAGATRHPASQTDLLRLLEEQSRAVGPDGVLVVAFATHGFSNENGIHYLAASDSLLEYPETAVLTSKVLEILGRSRAFRRLAFLDACRERLTRSSRSVAGDIRSAVPARLAEAIARVRGQVIFFAARPGGFTGDDHERKNGVFTSAVLDGLRCDAETDERGFVTVDTLATFLNQEVPDRRQSLHSANPEEGIEVNLGGLAKLLPLASCDEPPPPPPVRVRVENNLLNVFDEAGVRLWGKEVSGRISKAEVSDLDGDGMNEVVVGIGNRGDDTGKILAFDHGGEPLWTANTTSEYNYDGGHGERLTVETFVLGDLFRQGRQQIVALSVDADGWYQSRLTIWDSDGRLLSSYWHPGHLHKVAIGSKTPQHPRRIVVGAVNNDLRGAFGAEHSIGALFCLDPREIHGEAPPYFGRVGRGPYLWYGVFLPESQSVQRLDLLDRNRDGEAEISVWTSTGHVFYLSFEGEVIGRARSDGAQGESRFGLLVEREE